MILLPTEWVETTLDNIADWGSGGTPSRKNEDYYGGDIPWFKTGDLGNKVIKNPSEFINELGLKNSSAKLFPKGAVAIAMYGATIGKASILGIDATTNQACAVGNPKPHVTTSEFLYYFLLNEKDNFIAKGKGGAQPNISQALIKEHVAYLPSFAEQKEIVDQLDTLLAQVAATQARLASIPEIIKQFRQSVLSAAVTGKLTTDWIEQNKIHETARGLKNRWLKERADCFNAAQQELVNAGKVKKVKAMKPPVFPDMDTAIPESIPDHWIFISVNEFSQCLDNMRIPVKKDARSTDIGLYPYFGANGEVDRVDEYIFDDDLVLVTEDETFYGREKPIAYRYTGKCWVNNHAHVLKAMTKEANDYLCYALMYYKVIPWLSGTTGRAKLTQAALNSLPIGLPPYNELVEIVRRVEQLFAYADSIEQQAKAAKARVDKLTQAILAKAFRGELTADWRAANPDLISGDNSAAALLARIQAERATAKPRKRATKPAISPTSSGVTQ
ncbi:restriction endonuclease subunit S [Aeromonas bivalvium]|uniref:restriction endonuclease subunit S n=1 Tax=Aeromonas bivalvium TaxID=440079 RepID=UPI0038CF2F98